VTTDEVPNGPLHGVRVVELATVVMAPYAGQMLGDLGADVIKVEHGPDSSRLMGAGTTRGLSGVALNLHRNKRSISLDVKSDAGAKVLRQLLSTADVFLTNLRPGPLERLGLRYEDLAEEFPRLVYCESHGFASGTPEENAPVYDDIIQALTGLPSLNQKVLGTTAFMPSLIGDKITSRAHRRGTEGRGPDVRHGAVVQPGRTLGRRRHSRRARRLQPHHDPTPRSAPDHRWLRCDHALHR
jgi:crotonobetainyl-CoA:carnitine CoA-transferase CaiB-like acyl-CoA transferase